MSNTSNSDSIRSLLYQKNRSMKSRKKILIFNLNGRGWMLHYSSQFSNALSKNHDIRVIVPSYADTSLYSSTIELWKIRTNPTLASFIIDSVNIFSHIRLITKIWRFRPDIIQIMDNHPWYFFYLFLWKIFGAKIFVIQHDPFPHSGEKKWLFHQVAIWVNAFLRKCTDTLIIHGEKMKEKVIEIYKIPREKVMSIYHGSYDLFPEWEKNIPKRPNSFLFFWRIVEYKWLDTLLEAMILLEKDGIPYHLTIAWDGPLTKYEQLIEKVDPTHITLENRFIDDSEIASFFAWSHFVVLPYKDATASWIIPLAYSFRLPVIATDVGVLSEYVKDGETGFLIKKDDPALLAESIKKLLTDTRLAETLWESGFQFQKSYLSWEGIVKMVYS